MSQETELSSPDSGHASSGWLKLLRSATIAAVVVVVFINVVVGVIPPLIVFVLLWLGGLFWLRRATKGPAILLLVTFVLFLLLSGPFIVPAFTVPASAGDFITNLLSVLAVLVGIVSAIAVLRGARSSDTPKKVGLAAAALAVAGIVLSVVSTLGYEDATAREGDVELAAEDIEFSDTSLEAQEGEVSVFVDNADATFHTFTIDELDVNLGIPASKAARVTFQAPPGTYEFYCVPHKETMKGTLTVE